MFLALRAVFGTCQRTRLRSFTYLFADTLILPKQNLRRIFEIMDNSRTGKKNLGNKTKQSWPSQRERGDMATDEGFQQKVKAEEGDLFIFFYDKFKLLIILLVFNNKTVFNFLIIKCHKNHVVFLYRRWVYRCHQFG